LDAFDPERPPRETHTIAPPHMLAICTHERQQDIPWR
jgi:hypothetical protein